MKFLRSLSKKDLFGKICLLRVDLNVSEKETKTSPRVAGILPTIKFLIGNGAKVVILSHRGRPKPMKLTNSESRIQNLEFSLRPFAGILSRLLNEKVNFISLEILKDCLFSHSQECWNELFNNSKRKIFLLENLRFFKGEEKNDLKLAKQLANFGNLYINDAFSVSHRNVASVSAIVKFLPSYAGLLLEKEIKNLSAVVKKFKHPLVIILGGAKISDKISLIENFLAKADYFLIGGGIAHNFLLAQGLSIGDSIYEESTVGFAKKMLKNGKIILPVDYAVSAGKREKFKILDIGPNTTKMYAEIIKKAKTIIWNGPMGYFENKKFAKGSEAIIKAIINNKKAFSVVGGGETVSLFSLKPKIYNLFISTGGGAMLEYLAGKKLPGIKALK